MNELITKVRTRNVKSILSNVFSDLDEITASNGITRSSDDIKLGGILTESTTITGTDNDISITINDSDNSRGRLNIDSNSAQLNSRSATTNNVYVEARSNTAKMYTVNNFNTVLELYMDTAGLFKITGLPTSSSGLPSNAIWNDNGTLKIVL